MRGAIFGGVLDGAEIHNIKVDKYSHIPESLKNTEHSNAMENTNSIVNSVIMQASTRPTEQQIESSVAADTDVDAKFSQIGGGTVPSTLLIEAERIKGFETLNPSQQLVFKSIVKITNQVLSSIDINLRDDIKRNFENNYEQAISHGTLNIPKEIESYVENKVIQQHPNTYSHHSSRETLQEKELQLL